MTPEISINYEDKQEAEIFDTPEIKEAHEKFVELSNNLLARGIDFVKWTTTISIAVIIWIATSINSQSRPINPFLSLSIVFFIVAIIIALFIVYYVLTYWAWQTKAGLSKLRLLIGRDEKNRKSLGLTMPRVLYFVHEYNESTENVITYQQPDKFTFYIALHMSAIVLGLVFYLSSLVYV